MTVAVEGAPWGPAGPLFGVDRERSQAIRGDVQDALFLSPAQDFAILRVRTVQGIVVAVGALGHLRPGEEVQLTGQWEDHPRHGRRFRVAFSLSTIPQTLLGIERYLSTFSGIGPDTAKKITEKFRLDSIAVLEQDPERVAKIKGIGKKRAFKASAEAKERSQERALMIFLQGNGISAAYAARIQKAYGEAALVRIRENPYCLFQDIDGFGFRLADQVAQKLGMALDAPVRREAAVIFCLQQARDQGHTYLPRDILAQRVSGLLEDPDPPVESAASPEQAQHVAFIDWFEQALTALVGKKSIVIEDAQRIFLSDLNKAETRLAAQLIALCQIPPRWVPVLSTEQLASTHWSTGQQEAIRMALQSSIVVITGGPGTGKTSLVRFLVQLWRQHNKQVCLIAPTGRAAKRLAEATGHEAQTIHRALDWNPAWSAPSGKRFLQADLIVCDESSMLDTHVADALVQSVPLGATLVFVGDVEQLPSVGPGDVLRALIQSGRFPVTRLTEIFRQKEGSGIVLQASRVLLGQVPDQNMSNHEELRDFYFIESDDVSGLQSTLVKLCTERIPARFGMDPVEEIQVLTPMHRGEVGTTALNQLLQQRLNPLSQQEGQFLSRGTQRFSVGDKVMQIRNDYDRDVWNGDVGRITSVDVKAGTLCVLFDHRETKYKSTELEQLELAYAMSIHKSQGSEYPAVVIPLVLEHALLLQRNVLYTAITRGKRLVVVAGSRRALAKAVRHSDRLVRFTALADRLRSQTVGRNALTVV